MRILVVDDDSVVAESIRAILEDAGYDVTVVNDGQSALDVLQDTAPDLVVLDIIMPDMDGIEVCRRIRAKPFFARLPVIFLTAKSRPADIARGLDAGGDDYLVKPFDVIELPARIRAQLRRMPGGMLDPEVEYHENGRLRLYLAQPKVELDGQVIALTPTEHRLLYCLMTNLGRPVSVEQLLATVWDYPPGVGDPKLVRVHIANLRSKLGLPPDAPEYINNLHGRGYLIYSADPIIQ
ncbi:MAG: response regulator transcription factor [Chloroflexi bacterium]|nr:response regulator transcription factor [Chloroflexota bacterium]